MPGVVRQVAAGQHVCYDVSHTSWKGWGTQRRNKAEKEEVVEVCWSDDYKELKVKIIKIKYHKN